MVALLLLLTSCQTTSTVTADKPVPPPGLPVHMLADVGADSAERCIALMVAFCTKVEACSIADRMSCFRESQPLTCLDVTGIEEGEALACIHALDEAACSPLPMPVQCAGIGEMPVQHGGPESRDL